MKTLVTHIRFKSAVLKRMSSVRDSSGHCGAAGEEVLFVFSFVTASPSISQTYVYRTLPPNIRKFLASPIFLSLLPRCFVASICFSGAFLLLAILFMKIHLSVPLHFWYPFFLSIPVLLEVVLLCFSKWYTLSFPIFLYAEYNLSEFILPASLVPVVSFFRPCSLFELKHKIGCLPGDSCGPKLYFRNKWGWKLDKYLWNLNNYCFNCGICKINFTIRFPPSCT